MEQSLHRVYSALGPVPTVSGAPRTVRNQLLWFQLAKRAHPLLVPPCHVPSTKGHLEWPIAHLPSCGKSDQRDPRAGRADLMYVNWPVASIRSSVLRLAFFSSDWEDYSTPVELSGMRTIALYTASQAHS